MSPFRLVTQRPIETHEDLFLARYERLLAWALLLTDRDTAAAEDLVHDAFIQFTLARPDLDAIENPDGYLRQMLRNLRVSQGRRAAQKREQSLCIADYDSAELSLRTAEMHAGLSARQELQLICQFAIARRLNTKAASVLILRFFHGYLPTEIARLMLLEEVAGRGAVKQWLSLARREARQYLHEPQAPKFIGLSSEAESQALQIPRGVDDLDFIHALRAVLFAAPQPQACLSARQLKALYRSEQRKPIETPLLAHLVCCARCLEQVNRLLGLAALAGRFPDDPGGAASDGQRGLKLVRSRSIDNLKDASHRRRDETCEHHPTELHICANGFSVATHTVDAARNRLSLKIHLDEPLAFIEVFSEQGVRLLYLPVGAPPASALKQTAHLEFSDQRTLDATLNFASQWPTLELNYFDCGLRIADCGLEEVGSADERLSALLNFPSEPRGFLAKLKSAICNPQSAIPWLLRPVTITVLLALLLIAVVVGQKLGWWFVTPSPAPRGHDPRPGKVTPERQPTVVSKAESSSNKTSDGATSTAVPVISPSPVPVTATAELEVEALRLLQQAAADLGEQVEVKRTAQGQLQIEGLVETDVRKAELIRALSSIANHPAVVIRIETVAEAIRRQSIQSGLQTADATAGAHTRIEVEKTALPLAVELRTYLQARGGTATEEAIYNLAARLHTQARRALDHLYALQRLSKQITPAQFEALEPGAQAKYLGLLASHARAYATKVRPLRAELTTILNVSAPQLDPSNPIHDTAELYRAIAQLFALGKSANTLLDQSLTISSQQSNGTTIKSPQFWRTLANAERLAAQVESYTAKPRTTSQPPGRKQ